MSTVMLLKGAGLVHLGILGAAFAVPHIVKFKENLAQVAPFMRKLVWVYSAFIAIVVAGFGVGTLVNAEALASGTPLARSVCLFVAFFWVCRLVVQLFIFDPGPFARSKVLLAGYHSLTVAFVYLVVVYGMAGIRA